MDHDRNQALICLLARMLDGAAHVAVGNGSPIPAAAGLLAQALSDGAMRLSLLGSRRHNFFTDGAREMFDCAAQGRIDAFFMGGAQIDGGANVNLVGIGAYPGQTKRLPGSFGTAYLYFMVPRVILFRNEHSRRVLVPKVDFVSAPGTSADGLYRPGGPEALVTNLAVMRFDRDRRRFRLASVHAGHTVEEVRDNTGFDFDLADRVPTTAAPEPAHLALLRRRIGAELAEVYPEFAHAMFGEAA
jgi:glutaconate CoA-transferase subunit B